MLVAMGAPTTEGALELRPASTPSVSRAEVVCVTSAGLLFEAMAARQGHGGRRLRGDVRRRVWRKFRVHIQRHELVDVHDRRNQ